MFDEKNIDRNDAIGQRFGEMKKQVLPPPALEKAVSAGVPYRTRVRTATHVKRFAKAVVTYVLCIALFLGALFLLPRFLGGDPVPSDPVGGTPVGDRPRPTPAVTTKTDPEPDPPAVAEIVWAPWDYDPWFERDTAEPLPLGQLYYQLNPALAEGQTTDENTRYVMSFTYITADFRRYTLEEYLKDRGFQQHVYKSSQDPSYIMLFDLTEAEIKSITPESVQAYYGLDSAPAVVGIHRYMSKSGNLYNGTSHVNSEHFWYRADLMWGVGYLSDDGKYGLGDLRFYEDLDPETAESRGWTEDTKCAVVVCVGSLDHDVILGPCDDLFAAKGIEILPPDHCGAKNYYMEQYTLIAITLGDLWEFSVDDLADYYGYEPSSFIAACFLATPPSLTAMGGTLAE